MRQSSKGHRDEPPVLLVKWYDVTKWLLDRVDSFPKNQRFIFGQRLADRALNILEVLVEAAKQPVDNAAAPTPKAWRKSLRFI